MLSQILMVEWTHARTCKVGLTFLKAFDEYDLSGPTNYSKLY